MMFKKSTCKITYIGEISTQILVLPYVGQELNMVILLPSESTDVYTVTRQPWPQSPRSRLDPCRAPGSGNSCGAHRARCVGHSGGSLGKGCCRP